MFSKYIHHQAHDAVGQNDTARTYPSKVIILLERIKKDVDVHVK